MAGSAPRALDARRGLPHTRRFTVHALTVERGCRRGSCARESISSRSWRCWRPASSPCRSSGGSGSARCWAISRPGSSIGPFGLGLFADPEAILHVAELGVVMFLFIIGLEMEPARLWSLRKQIFGLGVLQVGVCGAAADRRRHRCSAFRRAVAFVAGMGFVLTSTAIVMQIARRARRAGDAAAASGSSRSCCSKTSPSCRCWRSSRSWRPAATEATPAAAAGSASASALGAVAALIVGRAAGSAQPAVPHPRRRQGARGDDGGGAAGGAGRGAGHAARRAVDGDGRVPRRRAAVDLDLPPPARGRRRAVPRHPARACSSSPSACRSTSTWSPPTGRSSRSASSATWWSRAAASTSSRALLEVEPRARRWSARVLMAQGGEFAFVLYTTAAAVGPHRRADQRDLHRDRHHLDGADAARHHRAAAVCPSREQSMEGVEVADGLTRQRAGHRLRPLRPDRQPAAAARRATTCRSSTTTPT